MNDVLKSRYEFICVGFDECFTKDFDNTGERESNVEHGDPSIGFVFNVT